MSQTIATQESNMTNSMPEHVWLFSILHTAGSTFCERLQAKSLGLMPNSQVFSYQIFVGTNLASTAFKHFQVQLGLQYMHTF